MNETSFGSLTFSVYMGMCVAHVEILSSSPCVIYIQCREERTREEFWLFRPPICMKNSGFGHRDDRPFLFQLLCIFIQNTVAFRQEVDQPTK